MKLILYLLQTVPSEFSKAANMKVKKAVRMEYVGCNSHGVYVAVDSRGQPIPRTDLTGGWREFREANGLVEGKMYCFEFNPNDQVIYVKEV